MPAQELIDKLAAERPNTDFLVVSRTIDRQLHIDLTNTLKSQKNEGCSLFLTTYGGDPHAGFRIARSLRHHYKSLRVIVPSYCKSAGTMILIAADELAICDLGELGPLDIQVTKPNEIQERSSGLDIMQALYACLSHAQEVFQQNFLNMRQRLKISTKQAGDLSSQLASGLLSPLYSQIDPLRIGEMQRATMITLEYGRRLNLHSKNLLNGALERLVSSYPAHGFVIDRKEAKELFKRVSAPTIAENEICSAMWQQLGLESQTGPLMLTPTVISDENLPNPAIQGADHEIQRQHSDAAPTAPVTTHPDVTAPTVHRGNGGSAKKSGSKGNRRRKASV